MEQLKVDKRDLQTSADDRKQEVIQFKELLEHEQQTIANCHGSRREGAQACFTLGRDPPTGDRG